MTTPGLDRAIANMRADAERASQSPDLAQRLSGEFIMAVLPHYMEVLQKAVCSASLRGADVPDTIHAMTIATNMVCGNIVQNLVGALSPTLGVSRDAAFLTVIESLLPMMRALHRMQMASLDTLERSDFSQGNEVAFDFRNHLKTRGEDHVEK